MAFRSYYSLTDMLIPVNKTCDVDSHGSFGVHSNFSAQQQGPDLISDNLVEAAAGFSLHNLTFIDAESFESNWLPLEWSATGSWNRVSNYTYHGNYAASYSGSTVPSSGALDTPNLNCSDADTIVIDFWYRYNNLDANQFLLQYYNGSSWNLIGNLSIATQEERWLHSSCPFEWIQPDTG